MGVPGEDIAELAPIGATCVPVMMSFFLPRKAGDRPDVVPEGSVNFTFIRQLAETKRTDYSARTAMEAAYQLLSIESGVPEVFNSAYDVRKLMDASPSTRADADY
jgi:oleate hydratase